MRKILLALLAALCLLIPAAAMADSFTYPNIGASFTIPGNKYTIITADNVAGQAQWLEIHGLTAEGVVADFTERGVLLQAWTADADVCIEISAVADLYGQQLFNVNTASESERKEYRLGHSSDKTGEWRNQGYDYTSAQWKNYKNAQRFLALEYTRTYNGQTYRGYARKTVRSGWHIHVDYQVYNRGLKSTADQNALEEIMKTFVLEDVAGAKPSSGAAGTGVVSTAGSTAARVIFSSIPPEETNTGEFSVAGSGTTGQKIVGVAMRMTSSDVHRFEADVNAKGKFEIDVKLPKEGLWTMTYTVFNGEEVVEEGAFDAITYDETLIPVTLNANLPATMTLTGNSLTLSGVTMKQTTVQCIVDGRYEKTVKTNNTGKFTFTFDTKEEGIYNITLVFEKKGYDARRFRCEATREFTDEDRKQAIRDAEIHPTYAKLLADLRTDDPAYRGRYMLYTLNIREVQEANNGYLTFAGMSKTKAGVYKEVVVIRTGETPTWSEGSAIRMYLKCLGLYDVTGDEGTESYPYFDLQWVE